MVHYFNSPFSSTFLLKINKKYGLLWIVALKISRIVRHPSKTTVFNNKYIFFLSKARKRYSPLNQPYKQCYGEKLQFPFFSEMFIAILIFKTAKLLDFSETVFFYDEVRLATN